MDSTPTSTEAVTRRSFLGTAAAVSLAGPLAVPSFVALEARGDVQVVAPPGEPSEASVAAALLAVVRARVGEPPPRVDEAMLLADIESLVRADRRLARARLANADEPDTVFRA